MILLVYHGRLGTRVHSKVRLVLLATLVTLVNQVNIVHLHQLLNSVKLADQVNTDALYLKSKEGGGRLIAQSNGESCCWSTYHGKMKNSAIYSL